jgi:hypothetical protein
MVSPAANTHAHDHEWYVPEDAWIYEDGAMHLTEACRYVEQRSAGHSERLDETFYETMYECSERRSHRFDLVKIERYRGDDNMGAAVTVAEAADAFEMRDGMSQVLLEEIELEARERLSEGYDDDRHPLVVEWFAYDGVDTSTHTVDVRVTYDGLDAELQGWYRLTYEHTEAVRR